MSHACMSVSKLYWRSIQMEEQLVSYWTQEMESPIQCQFMKVMLSHTLSKESTWLVETLPLTCKRSLTKEDIASQPMLKLKS